MKRLVNVILKEFDELSFSKYYVLTICATNHEKMLDSAVWRRFNIIKRVPLPNEFERTGMVKMFLDNLIKFGVSINQKPLIISDMVKKTESYSGSEIKRAIDEVIVNIVIDKKKEINHEDFMNYFQKSKSESLLEVFASEISDKFSYPNPLIGDINPLLFEDLLIKYISEEKKYENLMQSAIMFDNLNNSAKKLLMTLNFCLFYQPNAQEYLTNLKKRSLSQKR